MNSIAGTLPDLPPRWPRNSFASMERPMAIRFSWGMDWPTSAIGGGFQPPERQVRFDTYLFRIALVRIVPPLWRTPVHHSETSDFHAISYDTSVLRPCRRGRTLVTVLRCELGTRIEPQHLRLRKITNVRGLRFASKLANPL